MAVRTTELRIPKTNNKILIRAISGTCLPTGRSVQYETTITDCAYLIEFLLTLIHAQPAYYTFIPF